MEEKRISVGFGEIHCFGSRKEKKKIKVWNFGLEPICMELWYGYLLRFVYGKYGFVG